MTEDGSGSRSGRSLSAEISEVRAQVAGMTRQVDGMITTLDTRKADKSTPSIWAARSGSFSKLIDRLTAHLATVSKDEGHVISVSHAVGETREKKRFSVIVVSEHHE